MALRATAALFVTLVTVELVANGLMLRSWLRLIGGVLMGTLGLLFALGVLNSQRPYPPADAFDWVWFVGGALTVLAFYLTRHEPEFPTALGWKFELAPPTALALMGGLNIFRTALAGG